MGASRIALLVASLTVACSNPGELRLRSEGAAVRVVAAPFQLVVEDAQHRVLLSSRVEAGTDAYGGPAATHDHFELVPQLLPGWDGYTPHEDPWRRGTEAELESIDDAHATVDLVREGELEIHLEIALEGSKVSLRFAAENPSGAPFDKSSLSFDLPAEEHFFGLGERYASVDHRGLSLYSWAEEGALGLGEDAPPGPTNPSPNGPSMTYFPVPFLLSSHGYGAWIDTSYRSEVHLGSETASAWRIAVNHDAFGLIVYANDDPRATLAAYTADTGRAPVPAQWTFGPRRRVSRDQFINGVPEWRLLRERRVPTTVLDDTVHFLPQRSELGQEAALTEWTRTMHAQGFKVVAYNNPYVSASLARGKADYDEGRAQGFFVLDDQGEPAQTVLISGELQSVVSVDFTNPDAVRWYQSLLERTLDLGYDGWMHDFGEYIERSWFLKGGRGDALHNVYPVLSAKAAHDLMEAKRPGDYLFFVRSGYVGTQQWVPEVWGGDPEVSFDETQGLPAMLRGGLNLGLSGVPYWGSDISGFKCITDSVRDKELYLRWAQVGAVSTSMHDENACANPLGRREKWTLWSDEETTRVYGDLARLHTRLAPYFMVLAHEAHNTGTPPMRHPFLVAPHDPEVWAIDDAFFLGPALFAAPVVRRGADVKEVYLPPLPHDARYVDLDDLAVYRGGEKVQIPAPLQKLPLLLVEGQILPRLDPSIETLATATVTTVITPAQVADRLDVTVALGPGGQATLTLADGTVLRAERGAGPSGSGGDDDFTRSSSAAIGGCERCYSKATGALDRWRINSALSAETAIAFEDLRLSSVSSRPLRVRWEILRLP